MEVSLEKKLELINKIPFFARLDDEDKITVAGLADFQQYETGACLIEEGSATDNLFFIINGTVNILKNNIFVVELAGGGHVFGEMSFVYQKPASASVVAHTKVVAMIVDTSRINAMVEPIYYKFRMEVYRSCAEILAKRLVDTTIAATT